MMKNSKTLLYICILLLCLAVTGCSVRHGDFTVVSSKLVRLSEFELEKANRVRGIEGRDVMHIIILFPCGGQPTIDGALDDALEKGGGDVMTDAVITSWSWFIPYIYGQAGWSIEGDVVKTRKY